MKIQVNFKNHMMVDMLEIVKKQVKEIVYEEENFIVCEINGFEIMIHSSGGMTMEKEIEEQEVSKEIKKATAQYMLFREMDGRFGYPWKVEVKIPFNSKDSCLQILESEGRYVEVSELVQRVYFTMSGEKFVSPL